MRNEAFEEQFLRGALANAHVYDDVFVHEVLSGLRIGAERYGDNAFVTRDNFREARDEARDLAAYCLMEYERLNATEPREESAADMARDYLGQVVVLAAQADLMLRLAGELVEDAGVAA